MAARRLVIVVVAVGLLVPAALAAPPRKLAPPVACTSQNRMDVFIDEDDIMYECQCQMLKSGTLCAWQVIGGVDAVASRKHRRRRVARVVAHTIPPILVRFHA